MVEKKASANLTVGFSLKWKISGIVCLGVAVLTILLVRLGDVGYTRQRQKQEEATARLIRELNLYISKMEGISQYIAGNKYVIERLQQSAELSRSKELNRDVLTALYSIKLVSQAAIVYLMNQEGTVIACTTYEGNQTLTGENYRFRPYFIRAMEKKNNIYAALGVTTGKRGLYFSSPVMVHEQENPIGVVVVKMGLESIDAMLANFSARAGIMSSEGIIFACNQPEWIFKAAVPLSPVRLKHIREQQQFAKEPLNPLPVLLNKDQLTIADEKYQLVKSSIIIPGWVGFTLNKLNASLPLVMVLLAAFVILLFTLLMILNTINNRKKRLFELEKNKAMEELRAQNEFMRTVLDSLSHPFYIINVDDYSVAMANRITGYGETKNQEPITCYYMTHHLDVPCASEPHHQCPLEIIKRTKQPVVLEHRHHKADGKVTYHIIHAYPIFNKEGRLIQMIEYNVDITAGKHMEEELVKKRQLEAIGILAGGIAHDFNNLLSVIIGNIEMVKDDIPEGEPHYKFLESAERNAAKAADLSKKLISFSRAGWLERTHLNIPDFIRNIVATDFVVLGVRFTMNFDKDLLSIHGDERQLSQVFHNVLQNALEAVEGMTDVEISLTARNIAGDDSKIIEQLQPLSRDSHAGYIKIEITDPGKGIPKENLTKVFDPYFTTKSPCSEKGVGLGLTLCYSIIKKHGGLITLRSEVGKGTTVEIYLPAYQETAPKR